MTGIPKGASPGIVRTASAGWEQHGRGCWKHPSGAVMEGNGGTTYRYVVRTATATKGFRTKQDAEAWVEAEASRREGGQ